ncbi:MAG TPA: HEAT repeat domain-containing protein [Polyangiaceae bacterium]|nr:HEAT repeat domain-containing protein [Polyangiaceae bacterium]
MVRRGPLALVVAVLLSSPLARAEVRAVAPAGGGLSALDARVDLARGVLVLQGSAPASGAQPAVEVPIGLSPAERPDEAKVVVEVVDIGQSKHVVHARVPARDSDDRAWEAIVAAGRREPIFAGVTGLSGGDPGERTGSRIEIVPKDNHQVVLVGQIREDLALCGQRTTLLDPRAVYPSLDLRSATVPRLSAEQRMAANNAERKVVVAKAAAAQAPLARLLVARGSSVPGTSGAELLDGDLTTVWSEARPGVGQGEFVVMAAPKDVPISTLRIVVSPPSPPAGGAAPKTFYLVTDTQTFAVTLPEDAWLAPGVGYDVALPEPVESSCLALVLESAFARSLPHPNVGITELVAYSEFDAPGATLDDVAKRLSSERGIAAAQVLERAGPGALSAVEKAYDKLDARGRALAVDVAASHERCDEAAPLLTRALCDGGDGQAPRRARAKIERCREAIPLIAQRLRDDAGSRLCLGPLLSILAPDVALDPLADALSAEGEADVEARAVLRASFARALAEAPAGRVAALIGDRKRPAAARLEILRAAGLRAAEAPAESDALTAELLGGSPPMRLRYLVLGPLGELARVGDRSALVHVTETLQRDPEWPVRVRAAEVASGLPDAGEALSKATRDAEPRVREAAFAALAATGTGRIPDEGYRAAMDALGRDGWSFVKAQAVAVLLNAPASSAVDDALGQALRDPSTRVRGAAMVALGRRRATSWRHAIRERLDDDGEDAEVRAAAARALGALCDTEAVDRLTELSRAMAAPGTDDDVRTIGMGALVGLAAMQPRDLAGRLAPLLVEGASGFVRAAAKRALASRAMCR